MKTLLKFGFLLLAIWFAVSANAQNFSINWHKVSGGGGTSTNAGFSLSGTIGQQDASDAMTGGSFSLTGGFWSLVSVVQMPGAPFLTITHLGNEAIVSWPPNVTGWVLQTNGNLRTSNWVDYGGPIVNNSMTNSPPRGTLFFRLFLP